jgi:SET domain-containing protein
MLYVKESTIPGAGLGLFTDAPIRKGEIIVAYEGEKITWAECIRRNEAQEGMNPYFFYISKNNCIDAQHTPEALGRYANDAKGYIRIAGLKNNAEYQVIKKKPYIVAKRNIKAGEEILVSYGKEYWDVMKEYLNKQASPQQSPQSSADAQVA